MILGQITIDGFKEAGQAGAINALLVSICLILGAVCVFLFRKYENKISENKELQILAMKREEERGKEFLESEKETLKILNGVTNVLEMIEKVNDQDTTNILNKIHEEANNIRTQIETLEKTIINKLEKTRK